MAEAEIAEAPETLTETERNNPSTQEMEVETPIAASVEAPAGAAAAHGDEANIKRERDEGVASDEENGGAKKQKVEKSVDGEQLEKSEGAEGEKESEQVSLGPKSFGSSVNIFDYFYKFLHYWTPNLNVNQYEHMVLLDLLKKGHLEPETKIGEGILAFQVRFHPQWRSRCFFIIRNDESVDDFSFRKCVDHILPLPEHLKIKSDVNKTLGGGGGRGKAGGGGRGGRRGHGRGRGRGRH